MKRRIVLFCLTLIILITNTEPALAAGTVAILSAEDVVLTDNTILVPVNILNNPGIMGFKVSASYPSELIEISSVTAGSVTAKGNFIHNAGKAAGQVDVIWYSTEQSTDDGSLFVLTVKPTDSFIEGESTQITLSFSQADTFNEQYEDVAFDCKQINVSYGKTEQPSTNPNLSQDDSTEVSITDSQLIDAVDAAIDNTEGGSVDHMDTDTLDAVNENLRTIAGPNAPQFNSVEELKKSYNAARMNEYTNQAQINIDPAVIADTLNGVLNSRNVSSFSELSDSDKSEAVAEAYQRMNSEDDTLPDISGLLSDDESASMFDRLLSEVSAENDQVETNSDSDNKNNFPVYIIIIIAFVIVCGVVIVIARQKRNNNTQEIKENKDKE